MTPPFLDTSPPLYTLYDLLASCLPFEHTHFTQLFLHHRHLHKPAMVQAAQDVYVVPLASFFLTLPTNVCIYALKPLL